MGDLADMAQDRTEQEDDLRRKEMESRPVLTIEDSLDNCIECEGLIPIQRQINVPGVETCVHCQSIIEEKQKRYA